jgi:hypothetical protein
MCGADVCLGIRVRDGGQAYIISADASGFWAFVGSKLVYSHHMHIRPRLVYLGLLVSTPRSSY